VDDVVVVVVDGIEDRANGNDSVVIVKLSLCEKRAGERETDDVGVVETTKKVDLCPGARFLSL